MLMTDQLGKRLTLSRDLGAKMLASYAHLYFAHREYNTSEHLTILLDDIMLCLCYTSLSILKTLHLLPRTGRPRLFTAADTVYFASHHTSRYIRALIAHIVRIKLTIFTNTMTTEHYTLL